MSCVSSALGVVLVSVVAASARAELVPSDAPGATQDRSVDAAARAQGTGLRLDQVLVRGVVSDVAALADGIIVTHVDDGVRRLARVDASATLRSDEPVPANVVAVGVCSAASGPLFIDERGLVDDHGVVVIAHPPLLSIPDPAALPIVDVCPTPRERTLLVKEGLAVVTLDDTGAPRDETILPLTHRARAFSGASQRALRGDRPYATALSVYVPWTVAIDVDEDGDRDLVLVHENRAVIFRRQPDGVLRGPAIERQLGALIGAPSGSDVRVAAVAGGLIVTASAGALPEHSIVATIKGSSERPLSTVARRDVVDGLVIHLSSSPQATVLARIDTSLVSLSGVVLTGRVPVELRRNAEVALSLPLVADVRAGRADGALPIVDVDLDADGVLDLVSLGEPGRATWWRGGRDGWTQSSSPLAVPKLDRALGAPRLRRVILVGRPGPRGTTIGLLGAQGANRSPR